MELVEHNQSSIELAGHHDDHGHGGHMSQEQKNYLLKFGWWVYIASEIMLFASLIGVFLLAKRISPEQAHTLNVPLTTVNTFLLLTSSWAMVRSLAALHEDNIKGLQRWLFVTLSLGTIFVIIQGYEYVELGHHGLTLSSSMFASAFYVLTAFHGAHVVIGVVWLAWAFFQSLNGRFSSDNYIGIEVLGLYWHFVDVVWIFIFPIAYLL